MLVGKKELKSVIVQETILTLIDNGLLEEAKDYYFTNRELLDEGWLDKFIPPAMRRDWEQVTKDQEDEEKVAAAVEKILDSSPEGKRWEKEDLKKVIKQYQAQGGGKAIGGRWDLTPAEEKMAMSALDAITDNPADVENAKRAADSAAGGSEVEPVAPGAEEPTIPTKPVSPQKTAVALKQLIASPADRVALLKGLLYLFSNSSVVGVLDTVKPAQSKEAVLQLIKQLADMSPKVLKTFNNKMKADLFNQLIQSDPESAEADAAASRADQGAAGRFAKGRASGYSARFGQQSAKERQKSAKEKVGRSADTQHKATMAKIGLQEDMEKKINAFNGFGEQLAILHLIEEYANKKLYENRNHRRSKPIKKRKNVKK